jgi:hypothetical protein
MARPISPPRLIRGIDVGGDLNEIDERSWNAFYQFLADVFEPEGDVL